MNSKRDRPRLLAVGLAVVIALTLVWGASTSVPDFGAYNPEWDGTSELRTEASAVGSSPRVATGVDDYGRVNANETIAVILSPDEPYSDREAERVREFVDAGGTVVIAEDFGANSESLLQRLGASTRVDGRLVRDERNYYSSPNFISATDVTDSELTGATDRLILNHGTVLEPNGADVLVNTSSFAYLDANRNGSLDASESMQQYPVVTAEEIGSGRVVVVSDPSIFINSMVIDQSGNQQFTRALFDGYSHVLLDHSHSGSIPPLVRATQTVQQTPAVQGFVGSLLVGAILILSIRSGTGRSQEQRDRVLSSQLDRLRARLHETEKPLAEQNEAMTGIIKEDTKEESHD